MNRLYPIEPLLSGECPVFAEKNVASREWRFLERFPELGFVLRKQPALARDIEAHYVKMVDFVERHVAPNAIAIDRAMFENPDFLPDTVLQKACEYRLFSMLFPSVMGGAGTHPLAAFITYELIATHCLGLANLLGVNGLAITTLMATYDLRVLAIVIKRVCENEKKGIPTFLSTCVTEPGAGSDAEDPDEFAEAILRTRAKKVEGGYRLSGNKVFISNGALAAFHVVVAFDTEGDDAKSCHRPEDMHIFLVDAESPGITIARKEHKMGQKVCPASEIVFDNVFVPEQQRCRTGSTRETTFAYAGLSNVLGLTRGVVGGFATGVAEGAYRIALDYVRRNEFLGQPMASQQWVQIELANLARRAQVSRATYLGALLTGASMGLMEPAASVLDLRLPEALKDHPAVRQMRSRMTGSERINHWFGLLATRQTPLQREITCGYGDVAKVSCTDLAMENCQKALSLMGKNGLRHELGAEKLLRDCKLLQIYEGTNQINLLDYIKRRLARQFDAPSSGGAV